MRSEKWQKAVALGLMLVVLYVAISAMRYRCLHPEMTETQLFLRLWDAIRWTA